MEVLISMNLETEEGCRGVSSTWSAVVGGGCVYFLQWMAKSHPEWSKGRAGS